ncbi:MAG: hypothetical protein FWD65_08075, partial [Coriobacteriia bacterium]|nr:hypothetical protein [Coriobacteriia bacterium]
YLNKFKPAVGYGDGVAVNTPWVVTDAPGGNVFDIYYPNTAPVINVKRNVLYVRQPAKFTQADILRLAGVSITDPEESIPLSKISVSGYNTIKWNVANYPSGDGYQVQLEVRDTPGLLSPLVTISIFVQPKTTKFRPATDAEIKELPKAPAGKRWGVDEDGNYILYDPRSVAPKTVFSGVELPKTGDSVMLATPLVLVLPTLALLALRRRRRQAPLLDD